MAPSAYSGSPFIVVNLNCHSFPTGVLNEPLVSKEPQIIPNPMEHRTTIHWKEFLKDGQLVIYDLSGKVVFSTKKISGTSYSLHRGSLEAGTYFVRIAGGRDVKATGKLVVVN